SPDAVRALVAMLGVGDDAGGTLERTSVRDALVACGANAEKELTPLLTRPLSAAAATSAAWVLGELRTRAASPAIAQAMRRGTLPTASALHALAGAGTSDAVPVVLEFAADPNPLVRAEALRAASALLDPARPDGRAVEPLAAALRDARLSSDEHAQIAGLLGRTGAPRAAELLAPLASAQNPTLRLAAIDALGTLGPAGADEALLARIDDPNPAVRLHAAMALADAGGTAAREALLGKLDASDEVDRSAVLTALGG